MKRIMAALRKLQSVTTIECSRFLDVIHPPRRVMELREAGESIATHWRQEPTECGRLHRVGLYVLESPRSTEKSGDEFLLGGAALPEHSLSGLVDSALPGREVRPATCAALLVGGLPA